MEKKTYNGWTNYATWRVALEMFDALADDQVREWWMQCAENSSNGVPSIYLFSRFIKEMTVEAIFEAVEPLKPPKTHRDITMPEIVAGWASAFVEDVNFNEIAEYARGTMLHENTEGRAALALAWGLVTGIPSEGVDGSPAPTE